MRVHAHPLTGLLYQARMHLGTRLRGLLDGTPTSGSRDKKAAALSSGTVQMFGEGRHPNFRELLDTKISPFLTSHAYQFWRKKEHYFDSMFYRRG